MDDVALLQNVILLTLALTDLGDELNQDDERVCKDFAKEVRAIAYALHDLDQRIRASPSLPLFVSC